MEPKDMYGQSRGVIENVNFIIAIYSDAHMSDVQVVPEKGTVTFSSDLHDWSFNVE